MTVQYIILSFLVFIFSQIRSRWERMMYKFHTVLRLYAFRPFKILVIVPYKQKITAISALTQRFCAYEIRIRQIAEIDHV